jgi:sirohydrochlorin ferrochelatase
VNDTVVAEGPNGFGADKLTERAYAVPPGALRAGANTVTIESIEPVGTRGMPPWFMVRRVRIGTAPRN